MLTFVDNMSDIQFLSVLVVLLAYLTLLSDNGNQP